MCTTNRLYLPLFSPHMKRLDTVSLLEYICLPWGIRHIMEVSLITCFSISSTLLMYRRILKHWFWGTWNTHCYSSFCVIHNKCLRRGLDNHLLHRVSMVSLVLHYLLLSTRKRPLDFSNDLMLFYSFRLL